MIEERTAVTSSFPAGNDLEKLRRVSCLGAIRRADRGKLGIRLVPRDGNRGRAGSPSRSSR